MRLPVWLGFSRPSPPGGGSNSPVLTMTAAAVAGGTVDATVVVDPLVLLPPPSTLRAEFTSRSPVPLLKNKAPRPASAAAMAHNTTIDTRK